MIQAKGQGNCRLTHILTGRVMFDAAGILQVQTYTVQYELDVRLSIDRVPLFHFYQTVALTSRL